MLVDKASNRKYLNHIYFSAHLLIGPNNAGFIVICVNSKMWVIRCEGHETQHTGVKVNCEQRQYVVVGVDNLGHAGRYIDLRREERRVTIDGRDVDDHLLRTQQVRLKFGNRMLLVFL